MKHLLLASLLLITACGPVPSVPLDPYALEAQGARLVDAARGLQTATADAYIQQMLDRDATRSAFDFHATATQGAQAARQTDQAIEATAESGRLSSQATQQAAHVTGTSVALQQTAVAGQIAATATRIVALQLEEADQAAARRQWRTFAYLSLRLLLVVVGLAGAAAMARFLWWLSEYAIEWIDRRKRLIDTASGPFVLYTLPEGDTRWIPASDSYHLRPRPGLISAPPLPRADRIQPEIVDDPETVDGEEMLAGRLVLDAIGVSGNQAAVIPGWRVLQSRGRRWSSRDWQRAIRWLVERGAASVVEREGTRLSGEYPTLYALNVAIVGKQLSPTKEVDP